MRALVIDDSRAVRRILGTMLNRVGYAVTEAGDGRQGLDRLAEAGPPDVVLVDWNMPVMTGIEFVAAVRADRRYDPVPVLMVTTESDIGQVCRALAAGANEYVMKPFTEDVLMSKLALLGLAGGLA